MKLFTGGNVGSYTAAKLQAAFLGRSLNVGCRFEILDQKKNVVGKLTTVSSATVDMTPTRLVPGALTLNLLPEPALPITTVPFTRFIKAWFQIRMPDFGIAEWPAGVYVWTKPTETYLGKGVTTWQITMGDLTHLLAINGPGILGYVVQAGTVTTNQIAQILNQALPFTPDLSLLEQNSSTVAGSLSWDVIQQQNPTVAAYNGPAIQTPSGASGAPATSWLNILQVLYASLGYQPFRFDWAGNPVGKPFPINLFSVPPGVTFLSNSTSIVSPQTTATPNLDSFANVVYAIANNANANAFQGYAVADADTYLPGHTYSKTVCGQTVEAIVIDGTAADAVSLQARAVAELYVRMASVSDLSVEIHAWPVLEPWDVIGLQNPGATTIQNLLLNAFTFDLMTGKMKLQVPRITGT